MSSSDPVPAGSAWAYALSMIGAAHDVSSAPPPTAATLDKNSRRLNPPNGISDIHTPEEIDCAVGATGCVPRRQSVTAEV